MKSRVLWSVVVISTLVLGGCGGGSDQPELVEISGVVTHAGKPVPQLRIVFQPISGGRASNAQSDDNGQFKLMYTRETPGVIPGDHKVSVSYTPTDPNEFAKSSEPGYQAPEPYGAILKKYGNRETTSLKVTITESKEDLELKLD